MSSMTHNLIARVRRDTVPIAVVPADAADAWIRSLSAAQRGWLTRSGFKATPGASALLPGASGGLERAIFVTGEGTDIWSWSALAASLPKGSYRIAGRMAAAMASAAAVGWGLAAYEFPRSRKPRPDLHERVWPAANTGSTTGRENGW